MSLTFSDLAPKEPRDLLAAVLADQVRRGRVVHENGGYRLAVERFDPAVLAALREIGPFDPDESRTARRGRPGPRASDLARAFS